MSDHDDDLELQSTDDFEVEGNEQDLGEELDQQQAAESATDSEPEHEQNTEGGEGHEQKKDPVQAAIDKQHAKYREEQRRRMQAEQELQMLRQQAGASLDPEPAIHQVDQYADDIEEELKQRDESIRAHQAWQQRQQQQQYQQQQYQYQDQLAQQQKAAELTQAFFTNAQKDNIDQQALTQAVQTVGQYQLGHDVANYLLGDELGHQMTMALAKDPVLLTELAYMDNHQRILHLERNLRSKLSAKPRLTKGSQPPTRVSGKSLKRSGDYPELGDYEIE